MKIRTGLAAMLAVMGASALACSSDKGASHNEAPGSSAPAASVGDEDPAERTEQRLSDRQILSVISAANTGEIAQANAALPKLTHTEAMQFANMMIEMHTAAQERQAAMAQQKGLTPQANPLATELSRDSDDILKKLSTADRDDVDELYMESQVEVHQKVLEAIDDKLLPSASDPDLQQELQTSRTEVATHLQRAREIVEKLD